MENTCTPNIKSSYTYEDLLASGGGELFGKALNEESEEK